MNIIGRNQLEILADRPIEKSIAPKATTVSKAHLTPPLPRTMDLLLRDNIPNISCKLVEAPMIPRIMIPRAMRSLEERLSCNKRKARRRVTIELPEEIVLTRVTGPVASPR
jgi:hypothetical protein